MKIDELIEQKAEELHRVHAHDSGRLDEFRARARPRRRSQVWVLIGAALAVLLLFGPVALFLRSGDPSNSLPDANTPTASTDGDSTPPEASGEVSISERLFEMLGDGGLGPVMTSGSDLIVTGFDIVLRSADRGDTWEVTGSSPPGDDSLILTEAADGTLLAIGAHDGASSRLYRSADYGATWEQFELPAPPEIVRTSGFVLQHADGWIIAGVATQSSFDTDAAMYVWKSPDAVNWEFEKVADLEGRFAYIDAVEVVDNRVVVLSRSAQDTELDLFAMEETDDGWRRTELTPILESQAGLPSQPVNTLPKGAGIVGDRLHAWWSFADGSSDHLLAATVYRTGPGEWRAEPTTGVAPVTVTITTDGLIGTAHPGTLAPMLTPGFTAIVASNDGITWSEIGRVDGLYLRQLAQGDDGQFIATGNETEATEEGFTVPSSGIWEIALSDDLSDPVGASGTMRPGQGANQTVEELLRSAVDGYIPDTGRHVASYFSPPGGPVDFYLFELDTELAADGHPTRVIRNHCVAWGITERGFNGSCGTVPLEPVAEPMVAGVDVVEADQSGQVVVLTPPDVVRVIIRFRSGTEIAVEPANGISYAIWETGGFPETYEAINSDGSRQEFK